MRETSITVVFVYSFKWHTVEFIDCKFRKLKNKDAKLFKVYSQLALNKCLQGFFKKNVYEGNAIYFLFQKEFSKRL